MTEFFGALGSGVVSTLEILGQSSLQMSKQIGVGTIRTPYAIHAYVKGGYVWNAETEVWDVEAQAPTQPA